MVAKRVVQIVVLGNAAAGAEKQALALSARLRDRLRTHPAVVAAAGAGTDGVCCVRVPFHSHSVAHRLPPLLQIAAARLTGDAFFGYDLSAECKSRLSGDDADAKSSGARQPPLSVVIGCGRTTVALCATLKLMARRPRDVFNIQIQHPRVPLSWFDAVVAPRHDFAADYLKGDRRLQQRQQLHLTTGTVHDITRELLVQHTARWRERLAQYTHSKEESGSPRARVVWLVGGPCRGFAFTEEEALAMVQTFVRVLKSAAAENDNFAVLVTFSRRTPAKVVEIIERHLRESFTRDSQLFVWDGEGENPYYAFLGVASLVVTTPDSISMTTEAIASDKPVATISTERAKGKFLRFHEALVQAKLTSPFTEEAVAEALWSGAGVDREQSASPQESSSEALDQELSAIADDIAQQIVGGM